MAEIIIEANDGIQGVMNWQTTRYGWGWRGMLVKGDREWMNAVSSRFSDAKIESTQLKCYFTRLGIEIVCNYKCC